MKEVVLPARCTVADTNALVRAAADIADAVDGLRLNARAVTRFDALGAAMIAAALCKRSHLSSLQPTVMFPADPATAKFLDEIGFNRFFGTLEDSASRGEGTLEIRRLTVMDTLYVHELAELLAMRVPGVTEDSAHFLELCLMELLDNAFDHSESDIGPIVLARWHKQDQNVRLAVVDSGVGIPAALRAVSRFENLDDRELVTMAVLQKGVTSRVKRHGGLGLKLIRDVVTRRRGHLRVLAGSARFKATELSNECVPHRFYEGTAVEIDFRPGMEVAIPEPEQYF